MLGIGVALVLLDRHHPNTAAVAAPRIQPGTSAPRAVVEPKAAPSTTAVATTHNPSSAHSPKTTPAQRKALRKLSSLVADDPRGYTSVAVLNLSTHRWTKVGAVAGMTCASIAKVQLLESLLLKRQRHHTAPSSNEQALLVRMIEHSDNEAANDVFDAIGGRDAVLDLEPALHLNPKVHHLGADNLWGLTKTNATQEARLLKNLRSPKSPLSLKNRRYALSLMRHIESDQRWGVPVTADKGTDPAVKNGWLAVASDHNRWAVNSIGLVTVHTQVLAIAVMTQHGPSYAAGISRVEALARAASRAATA
jgi:hypothetical protein